MRCHAAVFPEPGGPEINRWGGFAWSATRSMVSIVDSSSASSEKRRGGYVSSQLAMRIIQRQRSLTICVNSLCLECLLLDISTASSELHENLATTVAAVDSVSLTVKAFVSPAKRTLVVYRFRHGQTDRPIGFEPVRQLTGLKDRPQAVLSCGSLTPVQGLSLRWRLQQPSDHRRKPSCWLHLHWLRFLPWSSHKLCGLLNP